MVTYLLINSVFLAATLFAVYALKLHRYDRTFFVVLMVLVICTALFDSLIIAADIVKYNPELRTGIDIWQAPVEDFFYSLVAAILVPAAWRYSDRKADSEKTPTSI